VSSIVHYVRGYIQLLFFSSSNYCYRLRVNLVYDVCVSSS